MIDTIQIAAAIVLLGLMGVEIARLEKKIIHLFEQNARLAANQIEIDKKIDAVDESTGADIFKLRKELTDFRNEYGDAAIEEMREAARSEKAWADGVNGIMSYGARFQVRGDTM